MIADYVESWFVTDTESLDLCLECYAEFDMERQALEDYIAVWERDGMENEH